MTPLGATCRSFPGRLPSTLERGGIGHPFMTFSVASLIACLREHRLLEGAPEKEIAALQEQFTDPRLLAKEMIGRGWLTPFQVNQVFQGRAADLLLGSYVLLERIGEGGMGQVFKA